MSVRRRLFWRQERTGGELEFERIGQELGKQFRLVLREFNVPL